MTLEALTTGVLGRDGHVFGPINLDGYNPEVNWSAVQNAAGAAIGGAGKTEIDNAIAGGRDLRLRIMAGKYAPAWLLAAVGSFTVVNCQDGKQGNVPRWWRPAYISYYDDLMTKLGNLYDGVVRAVWEVGGMHIYAEPFQRQFYSGITADVQNDSTGITKTGVQWAAQNRAAAIAAGYAYGSETTVGTDLWALEQFRQIMAAAWTQSRIGVAYNPVQYIDGSGNGVSDQAAAKRQMQLWYDLIGQQHIIQNNSIRQSMIANPNGPRPYTSRSQLYKDMVAMHDAGCPISFQTATWDRIHPKLGAATDAEKRDALEKTIYWAVDMGGHAVEAPAQFQNGCSQADVDVWSAALAGNAGGAPPSGPGTITAVGFDGGSGVGSPTLQVAGKILATGFDGGSGVGSPTVRWHRDSIPPPPPAEHRPHGRVELAGGGTFPHVHPGRWTPVVYLQSVWTGEDGVGIHEAIGATEGWFVGEDKVLEFSSDTDLEGWELEFTLTEDLSNISVLSKTTSGGSVVITGARTYQVIIDAEDTVELPDDILYRYAVSRTDVDGVLSHGEAVLQLR